MSYTEILAQGEEGESKLIKKDKFTMRQVLFPLSSWSMKLFFSYSPF